MKKKRVGVLFSFLSSIWNGFEMVTSQIELLLRNLINCYNEWVCDVTLNGILYYNLKHFHDDEIKIQFSHWHDRMNFMIVTPLRVILWLNFWQNLRHFLFMISLWFVLILFLLWLWICDKIWESLANSN